VTAVQRPAAQLAVALAQDLALVHHQIAGDDPWVPTNQGVLPMARCGLQREAHYAGQSECNRRVDLQTGGALRAAS